MTELSTDVKGNIELTTLSRRAYKMGSKVDFLTKYWTTAADNPYDHETNPKGIINLGTGVNRLMEHELQERLSRDDVMQFSSKDHQHYFDFGGTKRLREALSCFFGRHFTGGRNVPSDQFLVMNGVTSCLDSLAFGCCDVGDVLITPTPTYFGIFRDFEERGGVDVQPLYLQTQATGAEDFQLTAQALQDRIEELTSQGKKVKAFVLVNPQNPLGCIYEEQLVMDLLRVCARSKVHAIVDEIYALSIHSPETHFKSVLSFEQLPDPSRTHFLWGLSKDFGLAGLRIGVIHSANRELLSYLRAACNYQGTPSIIHDTVATMLNDRAWCDEYFLPLSRQRLGDSYRRAVKQLTDGGVRVFESHAAFFTWINISSFLKENTYKEEIAVFTEALSAGVYVVPGSVQHCQEPGWLRMVVSVSDDELSLGIERLLSVLHQRGKGEEKERVITPTIIRGIAST